MAKAKLTPFQQAILDSTLEDYNKLIEDVPKITASPAMEVWAQKNKKKRNLLPACRRMARAALIAAIFVVLLAGSVMAIPALRITVVEFFLRENSDHYGIAFDPEAAATAPEEVVQEYTIMYVPEGFIISKETVAVTCITRSWVNSVGDSLIFSQWTIAKGLPEDLRVKISNKQGKETVLMGEFLVDIIPMEDGNIFVWTNNEYFFVLDILANISYEEVEKILLSVTPKQ